MPSGLAKEYFTECKGLATKMRTCKGIDLDRTNDEGYCYCMLQLNKICGINGSLSGLEPITNCNLSNPELLTERHHTERTDKKKQYYADYDSDTLD